MPISRIDLMNKDKIFSDISDLEKKFPELYLKQHNWSNQYSYRNDISESLLFLQREYDPFNRFEKKWFKARNIYLILIKLFRRILRPFLNILFSKQIKMNEQILSMAFRIESLDNEIKELQSSILDLKSMSSHVVSKPINREDQDIEI